MTFRLLELRDSESIFEAWCQDPEVARFMAWVPHATVGNRLESRSVKVLSATAVIEPQDSRHERLQVGLKPNTAA
jgi:hypothetical protein